MSPFVALGLSPELAQAAGALGFSLPTPVQCAAIPAVLSGRDVLAVAATGSGKTAAFALPVLQRLAALRPEAARPTRVLVLAPTRELAVQVGDVMRAVARHLARPAKVVTLHGGVSINPQLMALRGGAEVVVATPGRLLDVLDHGGLSLAAVEVLALDEADRLLGAGFADEVAQVLSQVPPGRQTLLFSATWPAALQDHAERLLRSPVRIDTRDAPAASSTVEERAVEVDPARRTPLLRHLIARGGWSRVLVFVATRHACDHVADKLRRTGIAAAAFHGDASQGARSRLLADFKGGRLQVLVATDLGARGIDIAQLPVVVNFDLPRSADDHVHRIGRTGRAGEAGLAVSFIGAGAEAHFRLIEKRQGRRIPREQVEGFERTEVPVAGAAAGGLKGRRPNRKDKARAAAAAAAADGDA